MIVGGRGKSIGRNWLAAMFLILIAGCATHSTQVWNSRAGSFTRIQAYQELGLPQKVEDLHDELEIVTWKTRVGSETAIQHNWGQGYMAQSLDNSWLPRDAPHIPDEYLRLLFGPDGVLITWDRPAK